MTAVAALERRLTKSEYAEHLRCSIRWVEYRIADGLPSEMIAGRRKFRASVADQWLRREGYADPHGPARVGSSGQDQFAGSVENRHSDSSPPSQIAAVTAP